MEWYAATIIIFGMLVLLITIGVPVAFSLGAVSVLTLVVGGKLSLLPAMAHTAWGATNVFVLAAAAGFILMSEVLSNTPLGRKLFEAAYAWIERLPGSLMVVTVWVSAILGAISGTGVGVAAITGRIAVPEMEKRGYQIELATGTVAASSALGMVIPPSLPLIIYGFVTELSVGKLFMAGVIPGLLMATVYSAYVVARVRKNPSLAPRATSGAITWKWRFSRIPGTAPLFALIALTIGGIYLGWFTATEAAAMGAIGAMILALGMGSLTASNLWTTLKNTAVTTGMILMIIVGAMLFGYVLAVMQIPQALSAWVIGLGVNRWFVFIAIHVVLLILGMFLEVSSIILITMPILYPVSVALGFEPYWFAITVLINMCAAVVSPPMGLCVYVVKGICPHVEMAVIFRGVVPYVGLAMVVLLILALFPDLATWLPRTMMGGL